MPTHREVISLHVGQAGCQLGDACWEMYCLEHGVQPDGTIFPIFEQAYPENFFNTTEKKRFVPRAAFIDLEPSTLNKIRTGKFKSLFDPQSFISRKEDAANCFARGYLNLSKGIMDSILQSISSMANDCDRLQGFLLFRSYGGGTGSGLGARLLEKLHQEYPKCCMFEFAIYPDSRLSSVILEPYNTALATHKSLGCTSGTFIVENEACYDICDQLLNVPFPTYLNINRLMGQIVSSVTASFRFYGTLNVDFSELATNLIPFPLLQYPVISYAPFISKEQVSYQSITPSSLLCECFQPSNQLVKCDTRSGKCVACTILFRGDVTNSSVIEAAASIKAKNLIDFVEWCPTAFKTGVNDMSPVAVPDGDLAQVDRACLVLTNCTAIKSVWAKVSKKFDLMYSKKAFLHWYFAEGLEEEDFEQTKVDMASLENVYSEAGFSEFIDFKYDIPDMRLECLTEDRPSVRRYTKVTEVEDKKLQLSLKTIKF